MSEHGEESAGGKVIDHRRRSRQKGEIGLAPSFLAFAINGDAIERSEEHTSELQSP